MDTYRDLLDLIYAMPFDTGLWPKIMSRIVDLTGSMGAVLQSPALVNPAKTFSLYSAYNLDAEALIASVEPYAKDDPFSGSILASIAGDFGKVAHGFGAVGSLDTLARNPFWNEHMGAMAIGDLMALILHEPKDQAMPVLTSSANVTVRPIPRRPSPGFRLWPAICASRPGCFSRSSPSTRRVSAFKPSFINCQHHALCSGLPAMSPSPIRLS